MRKFLLITLLTGIVIQGFTQKPDRSGNKGSRPEIGRIYGKVIDSKSRKPIEFVTISLISPRDSTVKSGGVTDAKGRFDIQKIPVGKYLVSFDFIGYERNVVKNVELTPRTSVTRDMGTLELQLAVVDIAQAEIIEDAPFMEIDIDKKVFNVEEMITSEGESANEVLEGVPSVEVDIDGNVSLRGSENVTILIDGRPSGLTGAGRQALLDQIPASSIEKVEVLTNPSAKFDPDGMAGIINIVLKKNKLRGIHGNVKTSIGTGDNYNGSIGLNYRNEKFNLFSNYSYRYSDRFSEGLTDRWNITDEVSSLSSQISAGTRVLAGHSVNAGFDYYLTPKSTLGLSAVYSPRQSSNEDSVQYLTYDTSSQLEDFFQRNNEGSGESESLDFRLNFRKEFTSRNHFLDINASRSEFNDDNFAGFVESYFDLDMEPSGVDPQLEQISTISKGETWVFSADFEKPLGENGRLEAGGKSILRTVDTDLKAFLFSDFSWVDDTTRSNRFIFSENIHSVYTVVGQAFGQIGIQAGLRGELAETQSDLVTSDTLFTNDYLSLFPSGHLSYEFDKEKSIQLSYSRRVNRPRTRQVNPFPSYSDPLNLRVGNPFLLPEYINSLEAGYTLQKKSLTITSSVYYKGVRNSISRFKRVDSLGVSTTTYQNLGSLSSYGLELIAIYRPSKQFNINASANAFQTTQDPGGIASDLNTSAFGWSGKLMTTYKSNNDWDAQFSLRYRAPRDILQGNISQITWADIALKKYFFDRKGSIGLRVSDIFDTREFSFYSFGENFEQDSYRKRESRNLYVTLSYNFGKLEERDRSRRGGRSNDNGGGGGDEFGID